MEILNSSHVLLQREDKPTKKNCTETTVRLVVANVWKFESQIMLVKKLFRRWVLRAYICRLPRCKNLWIFSLFYCFCYCFPALYCFEKLCCLGRSLFYVTCQSHRLLLQGWAKLSASRSVPRFAHCYENVQASVKGTVSRLGEIYFIKFCQKLAMKVTFWKGNIFSWT